MTNLSKSASPSEPPKIIVCDGCHFSYDYAETNSLYCLRCLRMKAHLEAAEPRRDEREAPGALEWISQNASASGWDVGRFIQFVDEHNMIEELVNTLAAYEARASAAPLKQPRRPKNAPASITQAHWRLVRGGYWNFCDALAVIGRVENSTVPEHEGEFYWAAAAWGCGYKGDKYGYAKTLEEAQARVEEEVLEPASLPQPSLPQENADSLNTNSVASDGLKTTPSAGQTEGK